MKKIVFKFILMLGMVMMMISPVYAERLYGTLTTNVPYTAEASPQMAQDSIAETAFVVDGKSVAGQTPYLEVDYGKPYMISSVSFIFGNTDGIQSLKLEYTADGASWTTLKEGTFSPNEKIDNIYQPIKAFKLSFLQESGVVELYEMNVQTSFLTEVGHRKPVFADSSYEQKADKWSMEDLTDGTATFGYSSNPWDRNEDPYRKYAVTVDLEQTVALGQIVLFPRIDSDTFPKALEILVSEDNETYTRAGYAESIQSVSKENGFGISLGGIKGRYVRIQNVEMRSTGTVDGYLMQFSEAHIFRADSEDEGTIRLASEHVTVKEGKTFMLVPHYAYPDENVTFSFSSADPSIIKVDAEGLMRAISHGTTNVYITDSIRNTRKTVKVTVKKREFDLMAFYPPTPGYQTVEQYAYMKEAGFTSVLAGSWEWVTPEFMKESLAAANANGIKYYVTDTRANEFPSMPEEKVRAFVHEYQSLPGVAGYYLRDEPHPTANGYAATYKAMVDEDPDGAPHLNHLPGAYHLFSAESFKLYVDDWVAVLGPKYKEKISFDDYPFLQNYTYAEEFCMYNFDVFFHAAKKHDVDFEYYIQSESWDNIETTPESLAYHMSLGLAYGAKGFQYFTYFCTGTPGSSIMNSDGTKGAMFEPAKNANARAKKVEPYLAPAEALEVYHTGNIVGNETKLPEDFFFQVNHGKNTIVSHYRNIAKQEDYVLVVNKDYGKAPQNFAFSVNAATRVYDITDGTKQEMTLTNGKFYQTIEGGLFKLYAFEDGFTFDLPQTEPKNANLAAGKPVYVSSSPGCDGVGAINLTSETEGTLWKSVDGDNAPYVLLDLKQDEMIGAICLKSPEQLSGITIKVSRDNAFFDTIVSGAVLSGGNYKVNFLPTKARYVLVEFSSGGAVLDEIEVYEQSQVSLSYPSVRIQNGEATLTVENGSIAGIGCVSALYENGRLSGIRFIDESELVQGNTISLFNVQDAEHAEIKTFLWKGAIARMNPYCESLDYGDGKFVAKEAFQNDFDTNQWIAHTVDGYYSTQDRLEGFAYAFSCAEPIRVPDGYRFSMDLKAAQDAEDPNHWMSAVICLRSDRLAASYQNDNGIMLLIRGNELGIRTQKNWPFMFSGAQTFMTLPVSYSTERRLIVQDKGDEITISTIENGEELILGYIELDSFGATLYNPDKTQSFGTADASTYGGSYVGVCSFLRNATFDNFELTAHKN